jgi:hypothetical protein
MAEYYLVFGCQRGTKFAQSAPPMPWRKRNSIFKKVCHQIMEEQWYEIPQLTELCIFSKNLCTFAMRHTKSKSGLKLTPRLDSSHLQLQNDTIASNATINPLCILSF